jgi:hypothetical protein
MVEYDSEIYRPSLLKADQFSQSWSELELSAARSVWQSHGDGKRSTAGNILPLVQILEKDQPEYKGQHVAFMAPLEPNRKQAASVETFIHAMNNSPSRVGEQRGQEAGKALARMGEVDGWGYPSSVPHFNMKEGRYIYTESGGWVDMVHFLFYAGLAYQYKQNGESNPIGEAVQKGHWQEYLDPAHSSYSYEDLPSDKFGADFAVNHFDPNSHLTLGQQVEKYMKDQLKATDPKHAPNYETMPQQDSKNRPSRTNKTTTPVYTANNP